MKLLLDGIWHMGKVHGDKTEAKVPGSVYENLLNAGLINDPFWRDNEEKYYQICEDDYEFLKTFIVNEDMIQKDAVTLVCEGLDTLATLYLNRRLLGTTQNMHRIYPFSVKDTLKAGENELQIIFSSPVRYAQEMHIKSPVWGVFGTLAGYQHIRKAHYMFGWDWGPILPDMGIWKSIYLETSETARIEAVHFTQKHIDGCVELLTELDILSYNNENLTAQVEITHPNGAKTIVQESVLAGQCVIKAVIENPELWWPNGYGNQNLYGAHVSLFTSNAVIDSREYEIGLRTLELSAHKDKWGREFTFVVNGIKIFSMGANYIPQDNLLGRCTPEKTERLIKDCVAAHYNMLRVWGGGLYADDHFLKLCDRYGILVWQDFPFACAVYDLVDDFKENTTREVEDNIRRMRHHASLALWCGNNEIESAWAHWGLPQNEKLKSDYLEMFERLIPRLVKQNDPQRCYWPSSPSSYGGFDKPSDPNHGDTHYWEVWHGMKPFEDYKNHYFRFCSEFGFQSFPNMKTIESFTLPEDRNIFSYVMERHQKNTAANGKMLTSLADNYRYPKDLKQLVYATQLLQADAIGCGVEHMRRNRGRCMGATYWQVNDCWPVASWSSIDYYGRWKALHYAAKRFFAPVLLSCDEQDGLVKLNVSNEQRTPFSGTVRWSLKENTGIILKEGTEQVSVDALSAQDVYMLDLVKELSDTKKRMNTYLEYQLIENHTTISYGTHLFIKAKHFFFINPEITFGIKESDTYFMIRLLSKAYAKFVELLIEDTDALFSDNYFDLTNGNERVITVKKDERTQGLTVEDLEKRLKINSVFDIA